MDKFYWTKNPLCSTSQPPLPALGNHWYFYCLPSFAIFRMSLSWNQIVCSLSIWLLIISSVNLRMVHVFHNMIAYFFLALNNITWSVCNTIYSSLTKEDLGYSQVLSVKSNSATNIPVHVFVWTCFQLPWVNTKSITAE